MQFDIIVCVDSKNGIGKNGVIPWNEPTDMAFFRKTTLYCELPFKKNVVIMGRKTAESIKFPLTDRINVVISQSEKKSENQFHLNEFTYFSSLREALVSLKIFEGLGTVFIIGGAQLYSEALTYPGLRYIYINKLNSDYSCDTFFKFNSTDFEQIYSSKFNYITFEKYKNQSGEIEYLNLLRRVIQKGNTRATRNGSVYSVFGGTLTFDLSNDTLPVLTTKKMPIKTIFEELMFFIRGRTNTKELEKLGVNIWKGNTSLEFLKSVGLDYIEGDLGNMYGFNWRHFGAEYRGCESDYSCKGFDQLKYILDTLISDPNSRRLVMTTFDPANADKGCLYPCHGLVVQFYVSEGFLSCNMYQRSADLFLGLPFNITSYSLLTYLIGHITKLKPKKLNIYIGDAHIYSEHIDSVKTQLERIPYPFPKIQINSANKNIEDFEFTDLIISDYFHYDPIKAVMKV